MLVTTPGRAAGAAVLIISSLGDRPEAGLHHSRQAHHVPIGEPEAAVALGMADGRRLIGAMDAVMLLGEVEPGDADRTVRPRRELVLGLFVADVPEQVGLVVERRQEG